LLLAQRAAPQPRAGGPPRRPPAGALGLRPAAPAERGASAAERGPPRDGRLALHQAGAAPLRGGAAARSRTRKHLHADPAAVLLPVRRAAARPLLRREPRPQRRPAREDDDRPAAPAGRPAG